MLTSDQQYVLQLLRKSLKQDVFCEKIENIDLTTAANYITRNGILLTVYRCLPNDLKNRLGSQYIAAIKQSMLQNCNGVQVLHALSNAGLSCIALKGWELRGLYPNSTMRQMADLDILVTPYDFNIIKSVMEKLGYTVSTQSKWKHDSFIKNEVHVEMHKRLTDDSDVIHEWENGLWERAAAVEGNIYNMSPEDYYIFHFVHLHKDFMNGSLGLRRIADTWLLQKQSVNMDVVRIELEKFGIWKFHNSMLHLAHVTMGDEEMDDDTELLLKHAFAHGIYGSDRSYKAGRIAAMSKSGSLKAGKLKSAFAAIFLPYKRMKTQFPILKKWPMLLPYCWLKRIIRFLKGDKKKYSHMLDYSDVSESDYNEMKRFFKVGRVL